MVNFKLSCSSFNNLFFNWAFSYQSINYDLLFLSYSMSAVNCLQINLRVPITIKNYNYVCTMQIDAKTTSSCWQYEDLFIGLRILKHINSLFSITGRCLSINTTVLESPKSEVVIEYVHKSCHLAEYQDLKSLFKKFGQQKIKNFKFHWCFNKMFTVHKRRTWFHVFKKIRMIANFFKLH